MCTGYIYWYMLVCLLIFVCVYRDRGVKFNGDVLNRNDIDCTLHNIILKLVK